MKPVLVAVEKCCSCGSTDAVELESVAGERVRWCSCGLVAVTDAGDGTVQRIVHSFATDYGEKCEERLR